MKPFSSGNKEGVRREGEEEKGLVGGLSWLMASSPLTANLTELKGAAS